MTKILVHARGTVGKNMGSTGVRSYHTARVLAEQLPEAQVTLSVPNQPDIPSPHPRLRIVRCGNQLSSLLQMLRHDIIISRNFPPYMMGLFPGKRLVLDFYSAFLIEWMEISKRIPNPGRRSVWSASNRHYVDLQLTLADYVLASNERQRDLWVGQLGALGLITPRTYDSDTTLRRLIDVVPYGVQPGGPQHSRRVMKGVMSAIRDTDKVIIWNGSIMEWFDAQTVVRAMAEVSRDRDDIKLFFLGTEHPDWVTGVLSSPPLETIELAMRLGLYQRTVLFNIGWVPYDDIGNFLAEADIGVCASYDNIESRYAFRTRYVDLFWADLPVICSRGDVLADLVEREGMGIAVPPGDVQAFAAAIVRLVDDNDFYQRCRRNMAAVKEELSWERVLAPLVEFCRDGRSIAAPKRQRLTPGLRRAARYVVTHLMQMRMG